MDEIGRELRVNLCCAVHVCTLYRVQCTFNTAEVECVVVHTDIQLGWSSDDVAFVGSVRRQQAR